LAISKDTKYDGLPIVWASLTVAGNKEYIKAQGILALPSMLFYAGSEGLVENFPCGPSKIPIMKRKLAQFVNDFVDPQTRNLKVMMQPSDVMAMMEEDEPCAERSIDSDSLTVAGVSLSKDVMAKVRQIPFFSDLTEDEFTETLQKAKLRTCEKGNVIMREGKKGRTFYFIESGEVEVMVKTAFQDPMTAPSNYLGTMINRLSTNDYFGERALITGEHRAASVRAATKTRCFAFDKDDIPSSSVLSGKGVASAMRLAQVNDKYGVDVSEIEMIEARKQLEDSKMGSQIRGSVNTPEFLPGIDSDDDRTIVVGDASPSDQQLFASPAFTTSEDTIISLMQRLRIVKYASRCFDYISSTRPSWNAGALKRRSMLVDKLTSAQKQEFREVFNLIDVSEDNAISLLELKRVMESIGEEKTDDELQVMMQTGHSLDGTQVITFPDFMGIMAEAEFYHLFTETFKNLDKEGSGFVRAMDLDRVLCGMRDLISDDRKSIIDVEDKDMMIDYEQFSRMLLGGALSMGGDLTP
jgi:calmodulin